MSKKVFDIPTPTPRPNSGEAWITDKASTKSLVVPMPDDLHFKLKTHCLKHRVAMADLVRQLLVRELSNRTT